MSVLLLVEGPGDFHTIANLIIRSGVGTCRRFDENNKAPVDFAIKDLGGYPQLRKSLASELLSTEFGSYGLVVDADSDVAKRWLSVTDRLREIQSRLAFTLQEVPQEPNPSGTILRTGTPLKIGIWLWPDNTLTGDMESFAGMLVPPGDRLWPHANEAVQTLPETRFIETHRNKAHIHTWLAWQDPPGQQLGEAIRSATLHSDTSLAQTFLAWLTKLKETTP